MWGKFFKRIVCSFALMAFTATSVVPPSYAQSVMDLPQAGSMVNLSQGFAPVVLRGIKVDPQDPFKFEFILDPGQSKLEGDALKDESTRLIRYFLASVTTPEKDLWVNLSPYEQDRIIPEAFGLTEMGRDLLSQDYILKQVTSSLMYPDGETGKAFWQKVYAKAYDVYGTTDVPVDTFNKVWIAPDTAEVYEDNGVAFIGESHLKVMLESDYMAANNTNVEASAQQAGAETQEMTKEIIREVMLPVIEREVNEGRNFAQLRQVYQSLILAAWYKKRLKDSVLNKVYADRNKVSGVDIEDKKESEKIWAQYVDAFKKGAYNYIKEEYDQYTQELIPRKYFSGGCDYAQIDKAMSFKPMSIGRTVIQTLAGAGVAFIVAMAFTPFSGHAQVQKDILPIEIAQVADTISPVQKIVAQKPGYIQQDIAYAFELIKSKSYEGFSILSESINRGDVSLKEGRSLIDAFSQKDSLFQDPLFLGFVRNGQVSDFMWFADKMKDYPLLAEEVKARYLALEDWQFLDYAGQFSSYGPEMSEAIRLRVENMSSDFVTIMVRADQLVNYPWAAGSVEEAGFIERMVRSRINENSYELCWNARNFIRYGERISGLFKTVAKGRPFNDLIYFIEYPWLMEVAKPGLEDVPARDVVSLTSYIVEMGMPVSSVDKDFFRVFLHDLHSLFQDEQADVTAQKMVWESLPYLLEYDKAPDLFEPGDQTVREFFIEQLKNAPTDGKVFFNMQVLWNGATLSQRARLSELASERIRNADPQLIRENQQFLREYPAEVQELVHQKLVESYLNYNWGVYTDFKSKISQWPESWQIDLFNKLDLGFVVEHSSYFNKASWWNKFIMDHLDGSGADVFMGHFYDFLKAARSDAERRQFKDKVSGLSLGALLTRDKDGHLYTLAVTGEEYGQREVSPKDVDFIFNVILEKGEEPQANANDIFNNSDIFIEAGERGLKILESRAPDAGFYPLLEHRDLLRDQLWYRPAVASCIQKTEANTVLLLFNPLMYFEGQDNPSEFMPLLQEAAGKASLESLLWLVPDQFSKEWLAEIIARKIQESGADEVLSLLKQNMFNSWGDAFSSLIEAKAVEASPGIFLETTPFFTIYPWFPEVLQAKLKAADAWDVVAFYKRLPQEVADELARKEAAAEYGRAQEEYTRYFDAENKPTDLFWQVFIPSLVGQEKFQRVNAMREGLNAARSTQGDMFLKDLTNWVAQNADSLDLYDQTFLRFVSLLSQYSTFAPQMERDVSGMYYVNASHIASIITERLNEPQQGYVNTAMAEVLRVIAHVISVNCQKAMSLMGETDTINGQDRLDSLYQIKQDILKEGSKLELDETDPHAQQIEAALDVQMQILQNEEQLTPDQYAQIFAAMIKVLEGFQKDTSNVSQQAAEFLGRHMAGQLASLQKKEWITDGLFNDMKAHLNGLGYDVDDTESDLQKFTRYMLSGNMKDIKYVMNKFVTRYSDFRDKNAVAILLVTLLVGASLLVSGYSGKKNRKRMLMTWMGWMVLAGGAATLSPVLLKEIKGILEVSDEELALFQESSEPVVPLQGSFTSDIVYTVVGDTITSTEKGAVAETVKDTVFATVKDSIPDNVFKGEAYDLKGFTKRTREGMHIPNPSVQLQVLDDKEGNAVAYITRVRPDGTAGMVFDGKPGEQGETGVTAEDLSRTMPEGTELLYEAVIGLTASGGAKPTGVMAVNGVDMSGEFNMNQGLLLVFPGGSIDVVNKDFFKPSDLTRKKEMNDKRFNLLNHPSYSKFLSIVKQEKISLIGSILLAYDGKVAKFIEDHRERRRALCLYKDGSIAFLDPKDEVSLKYLAELAFESGSKENPLVAAIYCDTGYYDFARLYTYDKEGKVQVEVLGWQDGDKSNNRGGLYYFPIKAQGVPDTVLSYRFSGSQDSISRRIHPEIFLEKEFLGIVMQAGVEKEALMPAELIERDTLLAHVRRALERGQDLVVLIKDPKSGEVRREKFVSSDASQSNTVDQAGLIDGGIDLDIGKLNLNIKGDGSAALNAFDPAMLAQFEAAPGLVPVIISITPANNLPAFLGLSYADDPEPSQATG